MEKSVKDNFFDNIIIFFFLSTCIIVGIAPIGAWIPLILTAFIIILFFQKKLL